MILRSKRLGVIETPEDSVLYLPDGILGFEEIKRFALVQDTTYQPFRWLISTEDPETCFGVIDPQMICAEGYEVGLSESDKDILDLQPGDPVSILVLVSSSEGGRRVTANLKGPVVCNERNGVAKQVVVYNPAYSFRQPLLSDETSKIRTTGVPRDRISA